MGPDEIAEEVVAADMEIELHKSRSRGTQTALTDAEERRTRALLELEGMGYTGNRLRQLLNSVR
jgi:hypothetical protein